MSFSRNTSSVASSVAASTPFCKVCRDAGRPEKEYTSHYVKDQPGPNGKVVCPTLLNQACRICNQSGHTSTYCPQYRPRDRENNHDERREEPEKHDDWVQVERRVRNDRRVPYAHPHGPRVRLALETRALSYTTATAVPTKTVQAPEPEPVEPARECDPVDIRKVDLQHAERWSEEEPYLMTDYMFRELTKTVNVSM